SARPRRPGSGPPRSAIRSSGGSARPGRTAPSGRPTSGPAPSRPCRARRPTPSWPPSRPRRRAKRCRPAPRPEHAGPPGTRAPAVNLLARSARLAGKAEIAAEAESRARRIDAQLDAEYHEKVPPFKPEPFAGRAGGKGDRTVLMEIFTGAECPPCVAADVAF